MEPDTAGKIAFLQQFKADILSHFNGDGDEATRVRINRGTQRAKTLVAEAGAMKAVTLTPPAAIGGPIHRNADPFGLILQDYYGMSMAPAVADMIEESIGVLETPEAERSGYSSAANAKDSHRRTVGTVSGPELPATVTISWLVHHVPVRFWVWLAGIIVTVFAAGVKLGMWLN